MKTYYVTIPIHGKASIEVQAENEDDAVNKAVEFITMEHLDDWDVDSSEADVEEGTE